MSEESKSYFTPIVYLNDPENKFGMSMGISNGTSLTITVRGRSKQTESKDAIVLIMFEHKGAVSWLNHVLKLLDKQSTGFTIVNNYQIKEGDKYVSKKSPALTYKVDANGLLKFTFRETDQLVGVEFIFDPPKIEIFDESDEPMNKTTLVKNYTRYTIESLLTLVNDIVAHQKVLKSLEWSPTRGRKFVGKPQGNKSPAVLNEDFEY